MRFYTFPPAPNPARVGFFLNEKGLEIERVIVDFRNNEQNSTEHLARSPYGTVPVLELDDGTCLTESLPIMEYLEELHPEPSLIGRDPLERARNRSVERFVEMSVLLRVIRAVHATNSPLGLPANPALAEAELSRLPVAFKRVNDLIGDAEFVCGARPTIADCTLLAALNFARLGTLEIDPGLINLHRWFERFALRHL